MSECTNAVSNIDFTKVKPYGDTLNDGQVQLSFTLPVEDGEEACEAAKQLMKKMGFEEPAVVYHKDLGIKYTYFIMYATCSQTVDYTTIEVPKVDIEFMSMEGVEDFIAEKIGRDIVIVGACTGTDAHTVGIDAIMNMKGFDHHFGLERYKGIEAYNLGSQVQNEDLIAKAVELNADVILVSQVVTQKNVHIPNMTQLIEMLEAEGLRDKMVVVCGGPRVSHELAQELGYDAGFGPGSYANYVATFAVNQIVDRGLVNREHL